MHWFEGLLVPWKLSSFEALLVVFLLPTTFCFSSSSLVWVHHHPKRHSFPVQTACCDSVFCWSSCRQCPASSVHTIMCFYKSIRSDGSTAFLETSDGFVSLENRCKQLVWQSRSPSPAKLPSPASSSGHPSVRHAVHTAAQWCLMTARPQGPGGKAIATDSSNIDRTLGSLLALRLVRHSDSPFPAHLLLSPGRLAQTMSHRPPASEKGPGFLPTLFGCSYNYKTAEKQLEFGSPATGHPFIHSFWHRLHKDHLCLLTLSVSLWLTNCMNLQRALSDLAALALGTCTLSSDTHPSFNRHVVHNFKLKEHFKK